MQFYIWVFMLLMLACSSSNHLAWRNPWFRTLVSTRNEGEIAQKVAAWKPGDKDNPWEKSGFFEGDIVMPLSKNAVTRQSLLWPGGVVPFVIDSSFLKPSEVITILLAMGEINSLSCVQFRPWKYGDQDFLVITGSRSGCFSYIGRQGGPQLVNLQSGGCFASGAATHELLHALGFYHQHSVANRDDYINILWKNVDPEHYNDFTAVKPTDFTDLGVPYDYYSIMHYSSYIFSKNDKPTILIKGTNETIGANKRLSSGDVHKLRNLYSCSTHQRWIYG